MKIKRIVSLICAVAILGCVFTSCGSDKNKSDADVTLYQLQETNPDNPIATMTIKNVGDIVIELFPSEAPKAVENFIKHAQDGYYEGVTFHRVIEDFMIQGGDPTGTGTAGESIWGKPFKDEFTDNLYNFNGALAMANAGANDNGSQFFIVQTNKIVSENDMASIEASNKSTGSGRQSWNDEVKDAYKELGGTPWLDCKHTVFGQVREGLNLVTKIEIVDAVDNKPVEDVVIEKITITNN